MKKTLNDYKEVIKKLPLKKKYTKDELLIKDFLIDRKDNIEINDNIELIQYKCKVAGRFSEKDYLLHTVSLIPYPVFYKRENYSGHTPKLIKSDFLMKYVYENFI